MVSGAVPNPENKLFVGGCPPGSAEEDLRQIFEQHGTVEEVFIMRGGSRSGMACAFIRFETQAMAQAAIDAVHGQITLPKTAEPLVVRWADAPGNRRRESRDQRRKQNGGGPNGRENSMQGGYPPYMGMHPQMAGIAQMQAMQMHPQMAAFGGGFYPQSPMPHQQAALQQMAMMGFPPQPQQMAQMAQSWQHQQMQMQQMAMMGSPDPRQMAMGRPAGVDGFTKDGPGIDITNQGVVIGPSQHWPYS